MSIVINDVAPRVHYIATAGQTVFAIPFEFLAAGDIKIWANGILLYYVAPPIENWQYSLTGIGVSGGGSAVFGPPGRYAGDKVVIVRDMPVARTADLPTHGVFPVESLNEHLDAATAMIQQTEVNVQKRTLRMVDHDAPQALNPLPLQADRASKVLGFDADGQPNAQDINELLGGVIEEVEADRVAAEAAAAAATAAAASASTDADRAETAADAAEESAAEALESQLIAEAVLAQINRVVYQPETETLIARFTTPPHWHRKLAIDDLILGLKTAGIWDLLDVMWVTAAADSQASKLNWKGDPTYDLDDTGHAPTFTADRGWAGNGTTSYLNTGWQPTPDGVNFVLNSASAWIVSLTDVAENKDDLGDEGSAPHVRMRTRTATDIFMASVNDGSGTDFVVSERSIGFFGAQRRGATEKKLWINGRLHYPQYETASTSVSGSTQWLCGGNPTSFGTKQIGFAAYGASLEGKEFEFYEAVRRYFNSMGITLDIDDGLYPSEATTPIVITSDGNHNAFPGLAKLPNGTLVTLYRAGTSHTGAGVIVQKLSTDEGQTWGAATTVVATSDARDAEVVLLSTSNLLMSYFVTVGGVATPYVKHGAVSGDTITWGAAIAVPHPFVNVVSSAATSSRPLELASGRILYPIYGRHPPDTTEYTSGVAWSDDGGLTWPGFAIVVPGDDGTGASYNETNMVQFSDGEIFAMVRDATGAGGYVSSRSNDDGETWSAPDMTIRNVSGDNIDNPGRPSLALYGDDQLFFMGRKYPEPELLEGGSWGFFMASQDRGESFCYWQNLSGTGILQYVYSSIIVYSPTRLGVVFAVEATGQVSASLYYQEFTVGSADVPEPVGPIGPAGPAGPAGSPGPAGPSAPSYLRWACGDETTPITAGNAKLTDRLPYAFTATGARASLNVAQASGVPVGVDIKWWDGDSWESIFSVQISFDNGEATSATALVQPVLTKTSFADDDLIRIDVTSAGDGTAVGLKVTLLGSKT